MAKKFSELESKMSPASRERSDARCRQLFEELPPAELRRVRELSQKQNQHDKPIAK